MAGFFLPLSGGIDSSSVACIVSSMCDLVLEYCHREGEYMLSCFVLHESFLDSQVIKDLRKVMRLQENDPMPSTGKDIVK